jgi:hypothetical protein
VPPRGEADCIVDQVPQHRFDRFLADHFEVGRDLQSIFGLSWPICCSLAARAALLARRTDRRSSALGNAVAMSWSMRRAVLMRPSSFCSERSMAIAASFTSSGRPLRSDSVAWSHPVIANGKLYIRDQSLLLCYDVIAR